MSIAQERVIRRVMTLSDVDADFVFEIIERLISQKQSKKDEDLAEKRQAFLRLEELRNQFTFPVDFDPDKELAAAREEKYGNIG